MTFNPYAPPSPPLPGAPFEAVPTGSHGSPQPFNASEVVGAAWERFKEHSGFLIGVVVVMGLVRAPFTYAPTALALAKVISMTGVEFHLLTLVCSLVVQVFAGYLGIGFARIGLAIVRRQAPRFGDLFSGKGAGRNIALTLALGSLTTASSLIRILGVLADVPELHSIASVWMMLTLVPILLAWLAVSQATYFIADKDMSLGDAIRASLAATRGKRAEIFLASLLGGLLFFAGAMACGFGLLVTGPVFMMIFPVIYARLTGQDPAYVGYGGGPGGYSGGGGAPGAGWGAQSPSPYGGGYGPPPAGGYGAPPGY